MLQALIYVWNPTLPPPEPVPPQGGAVSSLTNFLSKATIGDVAHGFTYAELGFNALAIFIPGVDVTTLVCSGIESIGALACMILAITQLADDPRDEKTKYLGLGTVFSSFNGTVVLLDEVVKMTQCKPARIAVLVVRSGGCAAASYFDLSAGKKSGINVPRQGQVKEKIDMKMLEAVPQAAPKMEEVKSNGDDKGEKKEEDAVATAVHGKGVVESQKDDGGHASVTPHDAVPEGHQTIKSD